MTAESPAVSVVVPWHNTHPTRAQSWAWLRRWYEHHMPDAEIIEVQPGNGEEFNKPTLVNTGVQKASGEVVIVADSDVIPAVPGILQLAAQHALYAPWVVPHGQVFRLRPEPTTRLLGKPVTTTAFPYTPLVRHPYRGIPGGGAFAIRRELFMQIGGFDPAFTGWGGEDSAFGVVADSLLGVHLRYHHIPLLHLYHPPGPRSLHKDYAANVKRVQFYRQLAEQGREALAQHVGVIPPVRVSQSLPRPKRQDSITAWLLYLNSLGVKVSPRVASQKLSLISMAVNAEFKLKPR